MTYSTVFVIDLASRRVQIVGSTPHPHEMFLQHVVRTVTAADDGVLIQHRVLMCGRDTKWSAPVRARLSETGVRVVQTPYRAPNVNAYAERFVRSIKQECLNRAIPFGACHLRQTITADTASGIIRGWRTRSSMTARVDRWGSGFAVGRDSVDCSITTSERREPCS